MWLLLISVITLTPEGGHKVVPMYTDALKPTVGRNTFSCGIQEALQLDILKWSLGSRPYTYQSFNNRRIKIAIAFGLIHK